MHIRTTDFTRPNNPSELLHITRPQQGIVTEKLGRGLWRAQSTQDGATFEFDEKSDRFLCFAGSWPDVKAEITYHQTPTERFAIMAKPKTDLPIMISTRRYNSYIPAGSPIPTFEEISRADAKASRDRDSGSIMGALGYVAAPFVLAGIEAGAKLAKATGLTSHRSEPRRSFYLPEGYGRAPSL